MTSKILYTGDLRSETIHLRSQTLIETDAPVDNNGKGERFSPTDLVATALGSCMITLMAMKATDMGIELKGTTAEITKIMAADPRRISKIIVTIHVPALDLDEKQQKILINTAMTCPVAKSIHPDIEVDCAIKFA
ncbi:MAG: OsmC family protein [Chitinophagales bacterium]|nr:OsmC family protein [Chitinophagales bacterium]